ncbi:beta-glucosidase [Amycolatopsis australiensis]|uniref:Beta-glucosidase n=2 Tax=Amycolatopsis australiensis TaxID=546364 RepID=A0A1K1SWY2_9PSEU|nr:beta-glucosidase [Amycolatopsis australiensis]
MERSNTLFGRPSRRTALTASGVGLLMTVVMAAPASAQQGDGLASTRARAQELVAQMTLDEKLSFVTGATDPNSLGESGYIPGVPRLKIPPLRFADGSAGVRLAKHATAMPAPVALASSFDQNLATQYGAVLGKEARALGQDVVLAPMANSIRVPQAGRNFETFSEDPLVSSRTASGEITGVQSQGAMATMKHLAVNNQETDRLTLDAVIDDQTLHEIELPPFKAAVDAGVASVMCAYNKVNGTPSCGSPELMNEILRRQWAFQGWVLSDWQATASTDAITKGLDQEMPTEKFYGGALKNAITAGTVPLSTLDTAVTRILTQMARFHLLDDPAPARPVRDAADAAKVAKSVAERGSVLLRNVDGMLPLTGANASSIALIGPAANTPKIGGGGSSQVVPDTAVAPRQTISTRAGTGTVSYTPGIDLVGTPIPAASFTPAPPFAADGTVRLAADGSTDYRGSLTVSVTGDYRFTMGVSGSGLALLTLDGTTQFFTSSVPGIMRLHLNAGSHTIGITRLPGVGSGDLQVVPRWVTPNQVQEFFQPAVEAAKKAKTAIVFASDDDAEGTDRTTLTLPDYQDELIDAIASANPNTVVVLETGSAVTMPWLPKVRSVLQMWYPGQEGAAAAAALLFGDSEPAGRLSQTFPTATDATAIGGDKRRFPGVDRQVQYSEGIYTGYRWFAAQQVKPLFPFGFGLGYTKFAYSDLSTVWNGQTLVASLTVQNIGDRTGSDVPQVYVGPSPALRMPQAAFSLAGYTKITLAPGASTRVKITVDPAQLSSWNSETRSFQLGTGSRTVYAGPSSADLVLRQNVSVGGIGTGSR